MHFGVLSLVLLSVFFLPVIYDSTQAHAVVVPQEPAKAKKYIAFRDDDVAPTSNLASLKAVNAVHIEQNIPVTLGIVSHPYATRGNELLSNRPFLTYLWSIDNDPLFELAQHGYTHKNALLVAGNSEFSGQPYDVQLAMMRKGQDDMREAFGVTPMTFIPPFNAGDANTLRAAGTLGFKGYSAGTGGAFITYNNVSRLALSGASLDLDGLDLSAMTSITGDLLDRAPEGSTIVVLYHVWSFVNHDGTVNTEKVQTLELYTDYLKNRGDVDFVRLDHAAERVQLEHAARVPWVSSNAEDSAW